MARYSSIPLQTTQAATGSAPAQGAATLLEFNSASAFNYTLADPTTSTGVMQNFYNKGTGTATIVAPSGYFVGSNLSSQTGTTYAVVPLSYITVVSDGTNYILAVDSGGPIVANGAAAVTLSPTQLVTISPTGGLTIAPTTVAGTMDNVSIGATTASTGKFTSLNVTTTLSGTGVTNYFSSPSAIGNTSASTGAFTTLTSNGATTFTRNGQGSTNSDAAHTLLVTGGMGVSGTIYTLGLTETSSIAYKENVQPLTNALDVILNLMGVTYDRKDNKQHEAGLIAEEVYKHAPELVSLDSNGKPQGIYYTKISAYLIESIKTLQAEINELKGKK
jgi:hypothetical protein